MAKRKLGTSSSRNAPHGEKMIEVKIRFWTNNIAVESDRIRPKHAWSCGVVRMEANESHGIVPSAPKPFNSLMDVTAVIEKTLIEHEIVLLPSTKMRKYFSDLED